MHKIQIEISDELFNKIKMITTYENSKNYIKNKYRRDNFEVEDFIMGCVSDYVQQIEDANHLSFSSGKLQNNFKQLMINNELTAKQISDLTGIIPSTLSNILSNTKQPSLDSFIKLWTIFGMPNIQEVLYRK